MLSGTYSYGECWLDDLRFCPIDGNCTPPANVTITRPPGARGRVP